jgi:hypothetical protein
MQVLFVRHENHPSKTSSEIVPSVLSGVEFKKLFSHVPEGPPRLEVSFAAWFRHQFKELQPVQIF